MKKLLGIVSLLVVVGAVTAWLNPNFLSPYNLKNLSQWIGLFGILSVGAAFVIIAGGIDLSIGSVAVLAGSLTPLLIAGKGWPPLAAIQAALWLCAGLGLIHGLLVAKLRLQPFVVTLCGLLIYRGAARWITGDAVQGLGQGYPALRSLATGSVGPIAGGYQIPYPFLLALGLALAGTWFLTRTIHGRYLYALGRNERAARYSGINTDRMTILAYVLCSSCAGLGGVLFALDVNSVQPANFANFYELYAIAGAVLGGCSLRGGEGNLIGVLLGVAIIRLLFNSINLLGFKSQLEFAVVGVVILLGVATDEVLKRFAAWRALRRSGRVAAEGSKPKTN